MADNSYAFTQPSTPGYFTKGSGPADSNTPRQQYRPPAKRARPANSQPMGLQAEG